MATECGNCTKRSLEKIVDEVEWLWTKHTTHPTDFGIHSHTMCCVNKLKTTTNQTSNQCCSHLDRILRKINTQHIQYGTLNILSEDDNITWGMSRGSHSLIYLDENNANKPLFAFFDQNQLRQSKPCPRCSLICYIESNGYSKIWNLRLSNRYYFQFSALMDMVGPMTNYLMLRRCRRNKMMFSKFFKFNAYRLVTCMPPRGDRKYYVFSYYVQRLKSAEMLFRFLSLCNKRYHQKWIVEDMENMKFVKQILDNFMDESHQEEDDEENPFYEELVEILAKTYGDAINEKFGGTDLWVFKAKHDRNDRKKEKEKLQNMRSAELRNLIQCANQKCRVEFDGQITMKICKGCKAVYYCSRRCQKIGWKQGHMRYCSQVASI